MNKFKCVAKVFDCLNKAFETDICFDKHNDDEFEISYSINIYYLNDIKESYIHDVILNLIKSLNINITQENSSWEKRFIEDDTEDLFMGDIFINGPGAITLNKEYSKYNPWNLGD